MDKLEKEVNDSMGFIQYVFKFDEPEKAQIMNIIQYTIVAIIPLVILLKLIKVYIPDADDEKDNLIIATEIILQLCMMFVSLYFVHRMINFVPTYSGINYMDSNVFSMILPILMISLTIHTKLGDKIQILVDRLYDVYEGRTQNDKKDAKKNVKVTQPLSQQFMGNPSVEQLQPQMTNNKSMSNEYSLNPQQPTQSSPNFNNMYAGPTTPLVNANVPGMESFEPMAANDALGGLGGAFGSSF